MDRELEVEAGLSVPKVEEVELVSAALSLVLELWVAEAVV